MFFYGISRTFSTKNGEQYKTIGAFWDEMAKKYGLKNLTGLGYHWTEDTMEYAIGLKGEFFYNYDCEIRIPDKNWITVKGKTEDLGKIYERIYEEGSLDMEIETFTGNGDCEISYYRVNDDWMEERFEVRGLMFDTAKCSAFFSLRKSDPIDLISNLMHTAGSSIHWMDEASYGMCTHRCTPEETVLVYQLLHQTEAKQWRYVDELQDIPVTEEVKEKVLKLMGQLW